MDSRTANPASRGSPPMPDINKLIDQYVAVRDRRRVLEARHKQELEPYKKIMDEIGEKLLAVMQAAGVDNVAGSGGTAYQTTKLSATIRDGSAFRAFVVDKGLFELVDWRANANAVFEYINENNGVPPPGVNPSSYVTVGVRRPNDKE